MIEKVLCFVRKINSPEERDDLQEKQFVILQNSVVFQKCFRSWYVKSCVQICHARDKNRKTITDCNLQSDSKGSKITRVYSQWSKQPDERSHDVTSGQLPVLSDVENIVFKNFYCAKRFAVKFQGDPWGVFSGYDAIQWLESSILSFLSRA